MNSFKDKSLKKIFKKNMNKKVVKEYDGHIVALGRYSGEYRNAYKLVKDNGVKYYEM